MFEYSVSAFTANQLGISINVCETKIRNVSNDNNNNVGEALTRARVD